MTLKQIVSIVFALIILIIGWQFVNNSFANQHANQDLVIQMPISGRLAIYTLQGVHPQWWGTATYYLKRDQYSFSADKDQGTTANQSLRVQFSEGGTANVSGVVSWEMPYDVENIRRLHTLYGSQEAIDQQLIRPAIERSLYLTGTLMSSTEAFSAKKADFLHYFEDQVKNGIYETRAVDTKLPDPITGQEKTVKVVTIVMDGTGQIVRASDSPLKQFGITILPPAIKDIDFDVTVKAQIAEQQKAITQVQTAQAQAKEAEQKAITVEKQGEANAATAKWNQEVLKATAVTLAEQTRDVNKLNAEAATFYKQQQILEGEGDAEKKRLIMSADGALNQKVQAYIMVQQLWADAFAKHQGPLVPSVVTGGNYSGGGNNAGTNFMEFLGIKAAKDLSLDMSLPAGGNTSKR